MQALLSKRQPVHFELFTEVPEWFFHSTLEGNYTYHHFASDVGLVQKTPFDEDLRATVQKLKWLHSGEEQRLNTAADVLRERKTRLVLCDIAPSGIQAARRAGIPSVLIENFTWDFIYAGYRAEEPELHEIGLQLREVFDQATVHIQAKPVCRYDGKALEVEPVSRRPITSRSVIREKLCISENDPVVLITQGGIDTPPPGTGALGAFSGIKFLLPGSADNVQWEENLVRLPHHSDFYLPDLVYASDAVIGKLGYGTVAEVYQAGLPFGYIPRDSFPETRPMADFVQTEMHVVELSRADFSRGRWGEIPQKLLNFPRINRSDPNGADQIAEIIDGFLSR